MKASEARAKAKKAREDMKLAEIVQAAIRNIDRHAEQGKFSFTVKKVDDILKSELRKLGYKVEAHKIEDDYGSWSTSDTLDEISW